MGWKKLLLASALAFLGETSVAICRAQDLPPAPTPVAGAPGSPPVGPYAPVQPGFIPPPPPPPPGYMMNPYPDASGRLLRGDPSLEIPADRPPGWFGGLEADLVWPHIKNRLTASVP